MVLPRNRNPFFTSSYQLHSCQIFLHAQVSFKRCILDSGGNFGDWLFFHLIAIIFLFVFLGIHFKKDYMNVDKQTSMER